jgi:ketosteroid isomerase-like protein
MTQADEATIASHILALERAALDRWGKGDPGRFLDLSAAGVTYFDPFTEHRLDGHAALSAWYEPIRGKIQIDRDEIADPRVQVVGDIAILTFRFVSQGSEGTARWNATEVYQRFGEEWKIVHTHWSFTQPKLKGPDTAST